MRIKRTPPVEKHEVLQSENSNESIELKSLEVEGEGQNKNQPTNEDDPLTMEDKETKIKISNKSLQELKNLYREKWGKKNVGPVKRRETMLDLVFKQIENGWTNRGAEGASVTNQTT